MNELASTPQGEDESVRAAATNSTGLGDEKAPDEADAPAAAADADDGEPDDDGETETEIEHAGEKYRVPKALKSAFLMQADYTRKTQEIADKGRSLEERQNALQNHERLEKEHLARFGRLHALNEELARFGSVDWAAFRAKDPTRAQNLWQTVLQLKETRDQMLGQLQSEIQQKAFESQRDNAKRVEQGHAAVTRDIKDWNPELFGKVRDFGAREFGFDPGEIAAVYDPRMIKVLHRAYLGSQALQKLSASAQAAAIETLRPLPTVTGNGRTTRGPNDDQSVEEWMRRRNEQSRKKGR